jgi:hypothetical protein
MSYLRNILTNVVTAPLEYQGAEYQTLITQRTTAASNTVTPDPNVKMEEGLAYTIGANEPIWEDIPEERAELFTKRCYVGILDAAAVGVDTQCVLTAAVTRDITLTAVTYRPNAAIKGAATNFRTVSIVDASEAASPVTLAKYAFEASDNAEAEVEKEIPLESGHTAKAGVNLIAKSVHSGSGIADPGGVVLVTYTHD